jgi:hypothetical protein
MHCPYPLCSKQSKRDACQRCPSALPLALPLLLLLSLHVHCSAVVLSLLCAGFFLLHGPP